jgi:hypothetical protein
MSYQLRDKTADYCFAQFYCLFVSLMYIEMLEFTERNPAIALMFVAEL